MADDPKTALGGTTVTTSEVKPATEGGEITAEVHSDDLRPAPEAKTVAEGTAAADWHTSLPPEFQKEKSLESFKGKDVTEVLPAILKSFVESQKYIGGAVKLPGPDAKPEDIAAFWKKAGAIPDKPEDYKLQKPIFAKGIEMTDDELGGFAKFAHSQNIPPQMAQKVLHFYGEVMKAAIPNYEADSVKCVETLKDGTEQTDGTRAGGWGPATERNLGVAKRALFTVFGKDVAAKIESSNLGNDADFVRGMYQIGKQLIEEGVIPHEVGLGLDEQGAAAQLTTIINDPKHPYFHAGPGHDEAVAKVRSLMLMVTPG